MPHKSFSVHAGELARLVPPALAGMAVLLTACASGPGGRQGGEIAKPASKSGLDFALLPPPKASAGKYPQPIPVDRVPAQADLLFTDGTRAYNIRRWSKNNTLHYSDQDGVRKLVPHCRLKNREQNFEARAWRALDDGAPMMLVLCHQKTTWPITQTLDALGTKVEPNRMAITLFRGDQIIDTRDDFSRNVWWPQSISIHGTARPTIVFKPFFEDTRLVTVRDGRTIDVIALTPNFKPDRGEIDVVSEIGFAGPAQLIAWKPKKWKRPTPVRLFSINRDGTLKKRAKINFEHHFQHPDSYGSYDYFVIWLHDDPSIIIANPYGGGLEILAFDLNGSRVGKPAIVRLDAKGMTDIDKIKAMGKTVVFSDFPYLDNPFLREESVSCIEIDKTPGQPIAIAPCPAQTP